MICKDSVNFVTDSTFKANITEVSSKVDSVINVIPEIKNVTDNIFIAVCSLVFLIILILVLIIIFRYCLNKYIKDIEQKICNITAKWEYLKEKLDIKNENDYFKKLKKKLDAIDENEKKLEKIEDINKNLNELSKEFKTLGSVVEMLSQKQIEFSENLKQITIPKQNSYSEFNEISVQSQKYTPTEKPKIQQKIFWVSSPRQGFFEESEVHKYYKCETKSENEAYFYFSTDPNTKQIYFTNTKEKIYDIAEIQGYIDQNYSITNVQPGILKRNQNGDWELIKKATIKFS